MTASQTDRLYNLLPAVYRVRDAAQGEPLRALLSLVQQTHDAVEQDIAQLYENWFIETCQEWVVPYIGDLLGVRPLHAASPDTFSARAYVANTLDFRRRKGTAAMLEQLALEVTGWPAHVVEYFQLLATTQFLNHLRPANLATANLRDADGLELLGGPFETFAHTVDVRSIAAGAGRYNISNVGIFLWRLAGNHIGPISTDPAKGALQQGNARAVADPSDGRYWFDPLGIDAPLFNNPQPQSSDAGLLTEVNVPGLLRRRPLYDELEALRQAEVDALPSTFPTPSPNAVYFGDNPPFQIRLNGNPAQVPFDQIMICDIYDIPSVNPPNWRRPDSSKLYSPTTSSASGTAPTSISKPIVLSVDPVRGRIAFPTGAKLPKSIEVDYTYGFSGNIGAGPYDRTAWLNNTNPGLANFLNPTFKAAVVNTSDATKISGIVVPSLSAALDAWKIQPPGTTGVIVILDSRTYFEDLNIVIPVGSQLLIIAADWNLVRTSTPSNPSTASTPFNLVPKGLRPHLRGTMTVSGSPPAPSSTTGTAAAQSSTGSFFIDGLLMEGTLNINADHLSMFGLSHSTIAPGSSLVVMSTTPVDTAGLAINLYRTICGPIVLNANGTTLNATDSIVTSGTAGLATAQAIAAPGFPATPFTIQVDNEQMTVTSIVGYTWNVTRGATPKIHANGTVVTYLPTKTTINQVGGITSTAKTVTVVSASAFPPAPFVAGIDGEVIEVVSTNGNSWSIVRNANEATSHPNGAKVSFPINPPVTFINTVDGIQANSTLITVDTSMESSVNLTTTAVFGTTNATILSASNSLFTGLVAASRLQTGCVRYCYVPDGSQTSQRYACQPDLAIANLSASAQQSVIERLTPQFASTDFGQPGFAQLGSNCANEIATGADNGAEMGAFNFLQQPQRLANLQTALNEYLRFGLEAGTIEQT